MMKQQNILVELSFENNVNSRLEVIFFSGLKFKCLLNSNNFFLQNLYKEEAIIFSPKFLIKMNLVLKFINMYHSNLITFILIKEILILNTCTLNNHFFET